MGLSDFLPQFPPPPRPDLQPLPNTTPLTPLAAVLPPLLYYLALLILPPFPNTKTSLIPLARNLLALLSASLFLRLPLTHHVPFSIGLTYQLSLVGLYGACRVVDAFFISPYLFHHTPKRIQYHHCPLPSPHHPPRSPSESYFTLHFLRTAGQGLPVTETALPSPNPSPTTWPARLLFALELLLSMRGAGFSWSSPDVRHTRHTWLPSVRDRLHSIAVHVLPVLVLCWAVVRDVWEHYLRAGKGFDDMPVGVQVALTGALGGFLMGVFSLGYSLAAIAVVGGWEVVMGKGERGREGQRPLVFFPPLYTVRVWEVESVRGFWSHGWHRLFSRLFLVYGVWPGEWVERKVMGKGPGERADMGKVMGGFLSSAFVHSFAGHAVLGGWDGAGGEAWFFVGNGVAVVVEEGVKRIVKRIRGKGKGEKGGGLERWYDGIVGRVWWISVLLYTGSNFARGWTRAGLVTEMAGA